jgi:hypothetical protein
MIQIKKSCLIMFMMMKTKNKDLNNLKLHHLIKNLNPKLLKNYLRQIQINVESQWHLLTKFKINNNQTTKKNNKDY